MYKYIISLEIVIILRRLFTNWVMPRFFKILVFEFILSNNTGFRNGNTTNARDQAYNALFRL